MAHLIIEIIGWIGTVLILAAYLFLTQGKLKSDSSVYQGMNLVGAVGIGINSGVNHAYPSLGINIFWILIAIYGLFKAFRK